MMIDDVVEEVTEENAAIYKATGEMFIEKRKKLYWKPYAAYCID